jgi:hypothetical protein
MTGTSSVLVAGIFGLTGALVLAQAPAPAPATPAPAAQSAAPAAPPAAPPGTVKGTPAHDVAKGAQVLAEAQKALGGADKLKAVQRLEVKGKSARQPQGNFTIEGDFEYGFEFPDKFRHKENIGMQDVSIDILQILNGQEATTKTEMGGQGANLGNFDEGNRGGRGGRGGRGNDIARFLTGGAASDIPEENRKAVATQMARLAMLLLLNPRGEEVAWVGVAESPDGRADVLEFKTPDGVPTHLVLDEKTHMPLMLTWVGPVQSFNNRGGGGGGGGRGGDFRGGGPGNFPQSISPQQAQRQLAQQAQQQAQQPGQPQAQQPGQPQAQQPGQPQAQQPGQPQGQQQGRRGGGNTAPQQANLQMHVSDYKTVNGIKFPHLLQGGANNETSEEFVVKSLRVNPSFRADYFSK